MKQGDRFLKIVTCLLAAACLAYFGAAVVRHISAPLATVSALEYEADVSVSVTGCIVRDEMQLSSQYGTCHPIPEEGRKVSNGQIIALTGLYEGSSETFSALRRQIHTYSAATDGSVSQLTLDSSIDELLTQCAVQNTMHRTAHTPADSLRGLVLRDTADAEVLQTSLSGLEAELERLTATDVTGVRALAAEHSGWFSHTADGYEAILTPRLLETLDAQDFSALSGAAIPVADNIYGKLIRSGTWYYVTVLELSQLAGVEIGDTVTVTMGRDFPETMEMQVHRLDKTDPMACVLVLSCENHLQDITPLRTQTCTLTFRSYSGIRVPKAALHTHDNRNPGVYVLEGAVARWKPVQILLTTSDFYIVRWDSTSTAALWPGDDILLDPNLYDGKVVKQ